MQDSLLDRMSKCKDVNLLLTGDINSRTGIDADFVEGNILDVLGRHDNSTWVVLQDNFTLKQYPVDSLGNWFVEACWKCAVFFAFIS